MKTQLILIFSFFLAFSMTAQVTNYGVSTGTVGDGGSFFGYGAGKYSTVVSKHNTFIGHLSGAINTDALNSTFVGSSSGNSHQKGNNNTFIGMQSGFNSKNSYNNTFVGMRSGYSITEGRNNVFMGVSAGRLNTNGIGNFMAGYTAGQNMTGSNYNTFLGYQAAGSMISGSDNTLVGKRAGFAKGKGSNNTFIGANAGENNETGSGNIFIGSRAGFNTPGDNQLFIENSAAAIPLIYGNFRNDQVGINTTTIPKEYMLAVNGKIIAEEVRVQLNQNWPDYVFESDYDLMSIQELKKYIDKNKHLPDVPSAAQIEEEGLQVGEMNNVLLKKVEELSLYIIELQAQIDALKKQ